MSYKQTNLAYYKEAPQVDETSLVFEMEKYAYEENVYTPRNAEDSPLYQTIANNLNTFLADQQQRDCPVPSALSHGIIRCGGFGARTFRLTRRSTDCPRRRS